MIEWRRVVQPVDADSRVVDTRLVVYTHDLRFNSFGKINILVTSV